MADVMELNYKVSNEDFTRAGEASSDVKKKLKQLGVSPEAIRKVAIALYEGEINMIIHAYGKERRGILDGIDSCGNGGWSPMETSRKVPVLIAEGEDIDQQLKVPHGRFAHHNHSAVDIIACQALHGFSQLVELRHQDITICCITIKGLDVEMQILFETRHRLETCAQLHIVANICRHVEAYTSRTQRDT